ncbi:MAG TPA: tRNA (N(6)-L-threonylcarbamoyladenosine(37)-C(2))-methylthiotransferase MtaB [Candidatus Acidoferrales bacterium]|nr:tRNA (N(6)-L-threonylcarbamoyladenosine(37)-C(2))-methylthiotransferase MtaB [Candidatus Acidoferrales bacterium]
MATYYIENFGCRATQADAVAIEQRLVDQGHRPAAAEAADLLVVNTCTVTASADSRARQAIRGFHRRNPAAQIVVTGCYAQRAPEELAALGGVRWVIGNAHQREIPLLLEPAPGIPLCPSTFARGPERSRMGGTGADFVPLGRLAGEPLRPGPGAAKILAGHLLELTTVLVGPVERGAGGHTRPTLKIQDGCNNRCAFCVIPQVRGRSRSLPPEDVVGEIRRLAGAGAREVVLSGINLGSYGRDLVPRTNLETLIGRILDETAIDRLRLSSLEPMHLTADLVDRMAADQRIAPHFHIPLQSGSDRILAAMHRWYRAEHYARRIELIHERLPNAAIGADVIAGFPGETKADHRATLALVGRLPFSYLHVFSFSLRPGTEAARLASLVAPAAIRERASELRLLAAGKAAAFRLRQHGRLERALTLETKRDGATLALTGNYLAVGVRGDWPANRWVTVRLGDAGNGGLAGELLEDSANWAAAPPSCLSPVAEIL